MVADPALYTTSTVYATNTKTIISCAPTVTNCPVGSVTTETIALYTTVYPVTEGQGVASSTEIKNAASSTDVKSIASVSETKTSTVESTQYTTSTVYATNTKTIGEKVVTETIALYTTVCPVTESQTASQVESKSEIASKTDSQIVQPTAEAKTSSVQTTEYTTSTAYTTKIMTITSCSPEITNCPADSTAVVTQTIALYTVSELLLIFT